MPEATEPPISVSSQLPDSPISSTGTAKPAAQQAIPGLDPRHGYRAIRYNANALEQRQAQERANASWGHARPNSVFVAAIGNHWAPGSWQHVLDMVDYTNRHGFYCGLEEIMDRCSQPYDALGAMRNEAAMRAAAGYEFLAMVDNDV